MTKRWFFALIGWTLVGVFLVSLVMPSFGPHFGRLGFLLGDGSQMLVGIACGMTGCLFANWVEEHFADR